MIAEAVAAHHGPAGVAHDQIDIGVAIADGGDAQDFSAARLDVEGPAFTGLQRLDGQHRPRAEDRGPHAARQGIAQAVDASQESGTLGSRFTVSVLAKPGGDLTKLEAAIDKELAKIRTEAVQDDELTRAKNLVETGFVMRLQGVKDRAALLNMYEAEVKDPGYAQKDLARYRDATKEGMKAVAAKVLVPDARVIVRVVPRAKKEAKK